MSTRGVVAEKTYFPPKGQGLALQEKVSPEQAGFSTAVVEKIDRHIRENPVEGRSLRWAIWRNGYLVHLEGDFAAKVDVASLRKTWHAMSVGAAILQGKIPSLDQPISEWLPELECVKREATWRHVLTQSAGFDYPHGEHPEYRPGEMWTYSDWNLVRLNHAMARVYGKKDYNDNYEEVIRAAYFDAMGLEGWSLTTHFDKGSGMIDGIRFELNLDHMGRLGLLALSRGSWDGRELVPRWFVEELETKQTHGKKVNYWGPYDGKVGLPEDRFPEAPYGYLTWNNNDGNYYPGADTAWAWGSGAGGNKIFWHRDNKVVVATMGLAAKTTEWGIPHIVEESLQ